MNKTLFIVLFLLLISASAYADASSYEDVFSVSKLSFDTALYESKAMYQKNPNETNKIIYKSMLFLADKRNEMEKVLANSVILYFYLDNCPHCEKFKPVVRSIQDTIGVERVVSLNANESAYATKYGLKTAPALVAFWIDPTSNREEHLVIGGGETTKDYAISAYKDFVYKILKSEFTR